MVSGGFRHLPCLNADGKTIRSSYARIRESRSSRGALFTRYLGTRFSLSFTRIGDVVGLLDITKCLYEALEKLEKAHKSSKQLVDALQGMQSEWAQPANPELQNYVDIVRANAVLH